MLTGVILSGGPNHRMNGKIKGLQELFGEKIIHRQIKEMQRICDEIIIVTNQPKQFLPVVDNTIRIITDYIPNRGPLSGMHASFSLSRNNDLWVVGGDMPFISEPAAKWMWDRKIQLQLQAVIPVIEEKLYPLHAVYDKSCLKAIEDTIHTHRHRISDILPKISWEGVSESDLAEQNLPSYFVRDFNTPEEYKQIVETFQQDYIPK